MITKFQQTLVCAFSFLAFGLEDCWSASTLNTVDRGWYNSLGTHVTSNENYLVGVNASNVEYRNWFVFDLSGLGPIQSATIRAQLPGDGRITFESDQGAEDWTLLEFTGSVSDLVSGVNGLAVFNDLGHGTSYGTTTVTSGSEGNFIEVILNASAIVSMNSSSGLWAFGGIVSSIDGNPTSPDIIFGNTDQNDAVQLVVTVPEPSLTLLMSTALGACFLRRRRN
ncbi:MAG: PEP-CTERM sorting domain-containing protein [Prosthecobacter sp.]